MTAHARQDVAFLRCDDDAILHNKDVAVSVFQAYKDRRDMVERKGNKFANLMRQRYGTKNLPWNRYEKKALKYKKKYNLSDDEFEVFKRVALTGKTNLTNMYNLPNIFICGIV